LFFFSLHQLCDYCSSLPLFPYGNYPWLHIAPKCQVVCAPRHGLLFCSSSSDGPPLFFYIATHVFRRTSTSLRFLSFFSLASTYNIRGNMDPPFLFPPLRCFSLSPPPEYWIYVARRPPEDLRSVLMTPSFGTFPRAWTLSDHFHWFLLLSSGALLCRSDLHPCDIFFAVQTVLRQSGNTFFPSRISLFESDSISFLSGAFSFPGTLFSGQGFTSPLSLCIPYPEISILLPPPPPPPHPPPPPPPPHPPTTPPPPPRKLGNFLAFSIFDFLYFFFFLGGPNK